MSHLKLRASELSRAVEHKAYAYGVSPAVSTLLGEYVVEFISKIYERQTNKQLAQDAIGQNQPAVNAIQP